MGLKPRQPFVGFALCAMVGVLVAENLVVHAGFLWPIAFAITLVALVAVGFSHRLRVLPVTQETAKHILVWLAVTLFFFAWYSFWQADGAAVKLARRIPPEGCGMVAVGIVDEEPPDFGHFRLRSESVEIGGVTEKTSAEILVQWSGDPPLYGDRVEINGNARNLAAPRNPGEFDGPLIRRRQGLYSELRMRYPRDAKVLAHGQGRPFFATAFRLRHWMERTLARGIEDSPRETALIQSMVLGSRSESVQEMQKLFQYTGTLHLYVVSGMNVAMLAILLVWLFRIMRIPYRIIPLAVIPVLWIYCFATGLGASSLRATIAATVVFAGLAMERPALSWNTLGATLVALLIWSPGILFSPGFVHSFLLVAILMAFVRPVEARIQVFGRPDPFLPRSLWSNQVIAWDFCHRRMVGAVSLSLVAWLGAMPLMFIYFHLWSLATVPANLFGALVVGIILAEGLMSVIVGTFSSGFSAIFNSVNWCLAKSLLAVISFFASVPGGHSYIAVPSFGAKPACEIEVFDLIGGGATYIHTHSASKSGGSADWMLDCGTSFAYSRTIEPYLRTQGVNYLSGFILSHGDSKHIGGSQEILAEMVPTEVIDSPLKDRSSYRRDFHNALVAQWLGKTILWRGDVMTLSKGATLHVLFPPEGLHARAADDKALVLRLDIEQPSGGTTRVLFMSDAGFITEHWLLDNAPAEELHSDILVKGMHSSDESGTQEFLTVVHPALVVTSGADYPPTERIKEDWAEMVSAQGIQLLRQDQSGAVHINVMHGGEWTAEGYLSGKAAGNSQLPRPQPVPAPSSP